MSGYQSVVLLQEKVYIGGGEAPSDKDKQIVVVYDPKQDSYGTLPPYTYQYFAMAVVNNRLVLVGGWDMQREKKTQKLGVWNEQSKRWTHPLPPMTTGCCSPSVVTHNNRWLVVIGGYGDSIMHSRVEVLDTTESSDSSQWYQAASLPQPCAQTLPATIGNACYLLGGYTKGLVPSKKAFCACLDDLISQAVSQPTSGSAPPTLSPWQSLPDTPLTRSTALAFNGALLAIGGGYRESTAIYIYQPSTENWIEASAEGLPTRRSQCTCAVLPNGDLYVTGGDASTVARVEIATLQ